MVKDQAEGRGLDHRASAAASELLEAFQIILQPNPIRAAGNF